MCGALRPRPLRLLLQHDLQALGVGKYLYEVWPNYTYSGEVEALFPWERKAEKSLGKLISGTTTFYEDTLYAWH